jgi:hypothetical protein
MRNSCKILVGKPEMRAHLVDLGVDWRIYNTKMDLETV